MEQENLVYPEIFAYFLLSIYLILFWINRQQYHPKVAIFSRWVRWILFSTIVALISTSLTWTTRPFGAVFLVAFLSWFLIETVYSWIYIRALSFSELPLFPRYRETEKSEWPVDKRWMAAKAWMKENNFAQAAFLKAELTQDLVIRNAVFEDKKKAIRIQVLFFPQVGPKLLPSYILTSIVEGERCFTNNLLMPFGGVYPKNWKMIRRPLCSDIEKLYKIHKQRYLKNEAQIGSFSLDVEDDLNRQQQIIEQLNIEEGFLHMHQYQEEYGALSSKGRYRLWLEIWLLNYFGWPCFNRT